MIHNSYKQYLLISAAGLFAMALVMSGCQSKNLTQGPAGPGGAASAAGGVDVGNMHSVSASVPGTKLVVAHLTGWNATSGERTLSLTSASSRVSFGPADLPRLTSPTALAVKATLDASDPQHEHKLVQFNGLEGVRTDVLTTKDQTQAKVYLISELRDFVQVQLDLKGTAAQAEGENILRSARIRYRGVALHEPVRSFETSPVNDLEYFTFKSDCARYNCGRGVIARFAQSRGQMEIKIGTAGYAHGRVVDMGLESATPFDSIKVEGEYLLSAGTTTQLEDIYSEFTVKDLKHEQSQLSLAAGHTYLIRTINWPEEDLIVKMSVDAIDDGHVRARYQNLVEVPESVLNAQVEVMNAYTRSIEMPRNQGDVVLYNREVYGSFYFASFNFKYATSGNMFITRNGWDMYLTQSGNQNLYFRVPHSGSALGDVIDLGNGRSLESVSEADLPDFNTFNKRSRGAAPVVGHTYIIWHLSFDGSLTLGAVHVKEIGLNGAWALLSWKRLAVTDAPHFQSWMEIAPISEVRVGEVSNSKSCYLVTNQCEESAASYEESRIYFGGGVLSMDGRPYLAINGFARLPQRSAFESLTASSTEKLVGQWESYARDLKPGDKLAVRNENYFYRSLTVIEVVTVARDKILFKMRNLQRARTVYATMPTP